MPFVKCPQCGGEIHLSVAGSIGEWFREHSPNTKPGEFGASPCYVCWKGGGSDASSLTLSSRDAEQFVGAIESDAEPNGGLKRSAERYKAATGD